MICNLMSDVAAMGEMFLLVKPCAFYLEQGLFGQASTSNYSQRGGLGLLDAQVYQTEVLITIGWRFAQLIKAAVNLEFLPALANLKYGQSAICHMSPVGLQE